MKKFEYKRIYREVGYRELDMIGEAGWELYTAIEAIKYNILHLLSPVDMEIEDTFMMEGRRYKKLI